VGILAIFRSAPQHDIDALFAHPDRVRRLISQDPEPIPYVGWGKPKGVQVQTLLPASLHRMRDALRSRLDRLARPEDRDSWRPSESGEELDVDKAWHGIHYLLTETDYGGDPPLNFIFRGGREVRNVDIGYGSARAMTAGEVRELARALEALPPETLAERFDPAEMTRLSIYPDMIWERVDDHDDDPLGYVLDHYGDLREFVLRAADRDHGLVVYLA
jgi:hypothetical protein